MNDVLERVWTEIVSTVPVDSPTYKVYLELGHEIQRLEIELGNRLSEPDDGYRPDLNNAAVA